MRHVWQNTKERIDAHRLTPWGKAIYKPRKGTRRAGIVFFDCERVD